MAHAHRHVGRVPLRHARRPVDRLAGVAQPRRPPGEQPCGVHADGHLGQHPLHHLLVGDGAAELAALEGIASGQLQRVARQTGAGRRDADPAGAERRERDLQPVTLVAQPVRGGDASVLEDELVRARAADAHLSFLGAEPEPGRIGLDHEGGDAGLALRAVDRAEDDVASGVAGVGDPDLGAGEQVVVAVPASRQRQGRGVGAGARLGQREGAELAGRPSSAAGIAASAHRSRS